jgi:transketolase
VDVAKLLSNSGLSAKVVSMHTVKPLDETLLADVFEKFKLVAVVEEHGPIGGLGSAVAEWLAARPPQRARLVRFNTADEFIHEAGDQEYARKRFGLTAENISKSLEQAIATI